MAISNPRARLRAILKGKRAELASSVWDPMSARIGADLGFKVGLMGGSLASFTVLGAPDIILMTLTELAEQVRRACRADGVAVIVDSDHGFGNALNVMRTVEELENAGAAAVMVEDTLLPKPFAAKKTKLIPIAEAVGKMKAAVAARKDPNLVLFARTNIGVASPKEVIERLNAYDACGVDGLFVAGLKTRAQLEQVAAGVKKPIMLGGVGDDMLDIAYLTRNKVRVYARGHLSFPATVQAIHNTLKQQRDGVLRKDITGIADGDYVNKMLHDDQYKASMKEYLS
ncbi:MAG: isocitrate lyase/PEP mutase family protein [Rhodospirillales bacterium]